MTTLVQQSIIDDRRARQLSALALSKEIGISSNQLAALERGEDVPSLYTLQKLAKFFGWSATAIGKYVIDCKPTPAGPKRLRGVRKEARA